MNNITVSAYPRNWLDWVCLTSIGNNLIRVGIDHEDIDLVRAGTSIQTMQDHALATLAVYDGCLNALQTPNPNYSVPASFTPINFPVLPGLDSLTFYINQTRQLGGQFLDSTRLLRETLRNYYGALNANDNYYKVLYYNQVNSLVATLNQLKDTYANSLILLQNKMNSALPATAITITINDLITERDTVICCGFSAIESAIFDTLNTPLFERVIIISGFWASTFGSIPPADLAGTTVISNAAIRWQQYNLQDALPANFYSSVPTLSQWGLIILAFIFIATGIIFISKRQRTFALRGVMKA